LNAADIFKRHRGLIFFILAVVIAFFLIYALKSAVLPFVFGLVLAYLFLPVINWAEQKLPRRGKWLKAKRVFLILLIFIILFGLIGFFSYYIVTAVIEAIFVLMDNASAIISNSLLSLQQWTEGFRERFPSEMQQQIDDLIMNAGVTLGNTIEGAFVKGMSFVPSTFSMVLGFLALPIFLFYVLKDSERLKAGFYSAFSPWLAEHVRNILSIIERVLGRYIRAQLMLGFIVGYFCLVGLMVLDVDFAPALAALAAVTELIPIIGPWIGGAVAVIVTLATAPAKALWVAVLFLIVQILENNLLVPRIQGGYLRLNPAITMLLLVVGAYIAGLWGIILAAPLTATTVEIYRYFRLKMKEPEISQAGQL